MELLEALGVISNCAASTTVLIFLGVGVAYWLHERFKQGGK